MTFLDIFSLILAVAMSGAGHLIATNTPPGVLRYVGVRLWLTQFIIAEAVCGWLVVDMARRYDGAVDVAPWLYVVILVGAVLTHRQNVRFHLEFTDMFRTRDLPMQQSIWQVVDWARRYAVLYREVQVAVTGTGREVQLRRGDKIMATIALTDGDAQALFRDIGVRLLGRYDWPKGYVACMSVVFLRDGYDTGRWEINDGNGAVFARGT